MNENWNVNEPWSARSSVANLALFALNLVVWLFVSRFFSADFTLYLALFYHSLALFFDLFYSIFGAFSPSASRFLLSGSWQHWIPGNPCVSGNGQIQSWYTGLWMMEIEWAKITKLKAPLISKNVMISHQKPMGTVINQLNIFHCLWNC